MVSIACAGPQTVAEAPITVEGVVTVRGNEPFTGLWLDTDARTHYVLVLDPAERAGLANPARYRVSGHVYRDDWNGMSMAHLDVFEMSRIDG
jgi:hypothetical protein